MGQPKNVTQLRRVARLDGLINALTGIGVRGRDKTLGAVWSAENVSLQQLEARYRASDMAATIVELPVDEMFREGFDLSIPGKGGKEQSEAVIAHLEELGFLDKLHEALCWMRAYGGAGLLLGAEDGTEDLAQPLQEDGTESFQWMTLLGPNELRPATYFEDVRAPRYGEVETYKLKPEGRNDYSSRATLAAFDGVLVHESRILRFDGIRTSKRQRRTQSENGWGDSVLVRCQQVLDDYETSWRGAALLLANFAQSIMRIKGLAEMLVGEDGAAKLMERATAVQMSRSIANALIMDSEEEFEVVATPMAGYPEMLQQFAHRLSAAARIPVTLLQGQAPAGLNATGDNDVRNFYARVAAEQRKTLLPALTRILQLVFRSKDGPTGGVEPDNWSIKFRPLWRMTDEQTAELRNKQSQTDVAYINAQVLTPEEVAISRFGGDEYSMETVIDVAGRKAMAEADVERMAEEAESPPEAPATDPSAPAAGAGAQPRPTQAAATRLNAYDPNQPRDPAGRWGSGGGSSGKGGASGARALAPEVIKARLTAARKPYTGVDEGEFNSVINELGGDGKTASNLAEQFVANADHPVALNYRAAAIEGMAEGDADRRKHLTALERDSFVAYAANVQGVDAERANGALDMHLTATPEEVASFKAMAIASQAMHDEETVVYRGIHGRQAEAIKAAIATGGQVEIRLNVVTSFSEDAETATEFAALGADGRPKAHGVIVKMRVPKAAIAASHRAVPAFSRSREKEVLVLTEGGALVDAADIQIVK